MFDCASRFISRNEVTLSVGRVIVHVLPLQVRSHCGKCSMRSYLLLIRTNCAVGWSWCCCRYRQRGNWFRSGVDCRKYSRKTGGGTRKNLKGKHNFLYTGEHALQLSRSHQLCLFNEIHLLQKDQLLHRVYRLYLYFGRMNYNHISFSPFSLTNKSMRV